MVSAWEWFFFTFLAGNVDMGMCIYVYSTTELDSSNVPLLTQ